MSSAHGHRPCAVDLFAGAGGLSHGFAMAGFHVAAAVEIHPDPASTCQRNHPETRVLVGDVTTMAPELILEAAGHSIGRPTRRGELDVMIGGPPCQGFSFAGEKNTGDPRNRLIGEFINLCGVLRPRIAVMENVPGLAQMKRYRGWMVDQIVKSFRDVGYDTVEWAILAAEDYGVPQQRRRLFFVAAREATTFSWPEPTHGPRPGCEPFVTVLDAIGDLDFLEAGESADDYRLAATTDYQREMRRGSRRLHNHQATRHSSRVMERFAFIPEGRGAEAIPLEMRTKKDGLLRLSRGGLSRAIVSAPEDLIHYRSHRIPTVRETARLQSFPDSFVFLGQRTSGNRNRRVRYCSQTQQVGNAVPPRLARAVAQAVAGVL